MEHLENHPHAFLNANNFVIETKVFAEHNEALIEQTRQSIGAAYVINCCIHGNGSAGSEFYNGKFYGSKPFPDWIRDETNGTWVAPEGWTPPQPHPDWILDTSTNTWYPPDFNPETGE